MSTKDYRKYYDLERYLLTEVQPRFERTQRLSTFDFFCIVIWKANRSKSKLADRFRSLGYLNLDEAVADLTSGLVSAASNKNRLRVLVKDWKFRLPMASAILAVLYPARFTVYDVRVCGVLNKFARIKDRTDFDGMWSDYSDYVKAVRKAVPRAKSLREKDRFLWGQSFAEQLENDIRKGFNRKTTKK